MATIKDVAKEAGVGIATVSRVLNGSGYFDEATARAVRDAVVRLDYKRNIHWSRLAKQSSETACFLLGNRQSMNSMQMKVLMASERAFNAAGYDLVFTDIHYDAKPRPDELKLPRLLAIPGMVEGVILAGVHHPNLLEALSRLKIPYVLLGNTFLGPARWLKTDALTYDDVGGAYEVASYLVRLGHRRIAFIGDRSLPWFARRLTGYRKAVSESGLRPVEMTDQWRCTTVEYGQMAAAQLLRQPHPPTAIFGANDEVAAGVWKELVKRGLSIPRQISLAGFGERQEFLILEPSLTTVSVMQEQIGSDLAAMLLEKLSLREASMPSKVLPCQLIEKASCAPPSARLFESAG